MKKKFEQRKYYEGQQMLKTLYSRLINQNKYDKASKLLSEGALILMGHQKIKESIEITSDLINLWKQDPSDTTFNADRAKLLHELFCMIPQSERQSLNDFMRNILEWIKELKTQNASNKRAVQQMDVLLMPLYKSYAINLWNVKEYYKASAALVKTAATDKMVEMFAEWSQQSSSKETPYFITRIVLQYLCNGNVGGCRRFIESVCPRDDSRGPSLRHPLENFSDLLCESIERKSVVLYNVLIKTYEPLIQMEPRLIPFVQRAGFRCLGIPMPKSGGGLLGNFLNMLS